MEDHLRNKDRLRKEWEALCAYQAEPSSSLVAQREENAPKNRCPAVLTCAYARGRGGRGAVGATGGEWGWEGPWGQVGLSGGRGMGGGPPRHRLLDFQGGSCPTPPASGRTGSGEPASPRPGGPHRAHPRLSPVPCCPPALSPRLRTAAVAEGPGWHPWVTGSHLAPAPALGPSATSPAPPGAASALASTPLPLPALLSSAAPPPRPRARRPGPPPVPPALPARHSWAGARRPRRTAPPAPPGAGVSGTLLFQPKMGKRFPG